MYKYKAKITSVYDGDTCTADIDLGFFMVLRKVKIRMYGIDTAEMRGGTVETKKAAVSARDFLRSKILNQEVLVLSHGKGKYGRWLGELFIIDPVTKEEVNINKLLIEKGLAIDYFGGKKS